jgi:hypothetical protein
MMKKQQKKALEDNGSAGEPSPGAKLDNDEDGDVQDPSGQQDESAPSVAQWPCGASGDEAHTSTRCWSLVAISGW